MSTEFIKQLKSGTILPEKDNISQTLLSYWEKNEQELYDEFMELTGDCLEQMLVESLVELNEPLDDGFIDFIIEKSKNDKNFYELYHLQLVAAFSKQSHQDSEIQTKVLENLLKNSAIWSCDGDLPNLLENLNLPTTKTELLSRINGIS